MTIFTILQILGVWLLIVGVAVALDVIPPYLRDRKAWKTTEEAYKSEQASLRAMELARQNESTMMLKVVRLPKNVKHAGKHRLAV